MSSEAILGKVGAPKRFTIDTKAPGFKAGYMGKQNVIDGMNKSLKDLGVESVWFRGLRGATWTDLR